MFVCQKTRKLSGPKILFGYFRARYSLEKCSGRYVLPHLKTILQWANWFSSLSVSFTIDEMQFTNGLRIDYFFTICANGMDRDAAFPNGIRSCVLDMDESLQ